MTATENNHSIVILDYIFVFLKLGRKQVGISQIKQNTAVEIRVQSFINIVRLNYTLRNTL